MQDPQNYQYYDPSPRPVMVPWWQRGQTWIKVGLIGLGLVVIALVTVVVVNVLKNRELGQQSVDVMSQAAALESQIGAECDSGDTACLERARADAARTLGVSQACDELTADVYTNCVTLIAQDKQDPEACKTLSGADQTTCLDSAYLLSANTELKLVTCDQISEPTKQSACRTQVSANLVAQGKCVEADVDASVCSSALAVAAAIKTGDPAACATLPQDMERYDCERGINSVDDDHDQLVLADEFRLGLSDSNPDSDSDGLSDGNEVNEYQTDPAKADTDGDGFTDGTEVSGGYDPLK